MLTGRIDERDDARVAVTLQARRVRVAVWAVVDTGFNGHLSVPLSLARRCGWRRWGSQRYELANGRKVRQSVYVGAIVFSGARLPVLAVCSQGQDVLIGTKLLVGRLCEFDYVTRVVRIRRGGVVRDRGA